jgi:L-rhamnose mutarotase
MTRVAFTMKLKPGFLKEYKKRHDEIWPDLALELSKAGITDYSIFFDEETNALFAVQKQSENSTADLLADAMLTANKVTKLVGEWNTSRILCSGKHIEHWLNGVKVAECERGSDDYKVRIAASKFKDIHFPSIHLMIFSSSGSSFGKATSAS